MSCCVRWPNCYIYGSSAIHLRLSKPAQRERLRNEVKQTSPLREIHKGGSVEASGPTAERLHDDKAYKSAKSERENHFGIYQECRPGSLGVTNGRTYRKDCGGG